MNPWTIDFATGIADSNDREKYLSKFDMKQQKGLIEKINYEFSKLEYILDDQEPALNNYHRIRFDIESIGDDVDLYITHLIDSTEKCDFRIFLYVVSDTLKSCMNYFLLNGELNVLSILEQIFIQNEIMKFNSGIIGLTTQDESPESISMLLDLLNVFISQKENIYADGILKYFFLEFEESLKNYNLLVN